MLVSVFCLALLCLGAHPLQAHPDLVVEMARASAPPQLDGRLDDWQDVRWISFAPDAPHVSGRLAHDSPGEEAHSAGTAADLSGRFALQWGDEWLYLAALVTDNGRDVEGGQPWQWYCRDGVALFLDIPRDGDGPTWFVGDHAFAFSADPAYPPEGRWWRHGDLQGHQEEPAPTRLAVEQRPGGYALEAAIPLSLLTRFTPSFCPPFAGRTVGFMLLITDPDNGPRPFGGQLTYGGENDNDASWSQLRFNPDAAAAPPRLEIDPEEEEFEAELRADQRLILPAYLAGQQTDSLVAQQRLLAGKYFQIYLRKRPSRSSIRALSLAFTLWGNTRAIPQIRQAIARISPQEDVWDQVVPGLRQAFYLDGRIEEGLELVEKLESSVVPLKSRSALLLVLATSWMGDGQVEKARQGFAQIVAWSASAWHVGEARRYLAELERHAPQPP